LNKYSRLSMWLQWALALESHANLHVKRLTVTILMCFIRRRSPSAVVCPGAHVAVKMTLRNPSTKQLVNVGYGWGTFDCRSREFYSQLGAPNWSNHRCWKVFENVWWNRERVAFNKRSKHATNIKLLLKEGKRSVTAAAQCLLWFKKTTNINLTFQACRPFLQTNSGNISTRRLAELAGRKASSPVTRKNKRIFRLDVNHRFTLRSAMSWTRSCNCQSIAITQFRRIQDKSGNWNGKSLA